MGDEFLEHYGGQSSAELIAMQATHRIDSLVLAFEAAVEARRDAGHEPNALEQVILAVEAIEREVGNGGFAQLMSSGYAEHADYFSSSLRAIGCPELAELADQALAIASDGPLDPEEFESRLVEDESLYEPLNLLDERYYELEDAVADKLFDHIKAHRAQLDW
jgi:hypothetical protein